MSFSLRFYFVGVVHFVGVVRVLHKISCSRICVLKFEKFATYVYYTSFPCDYYFSFCKCECRLILIAEKKTVYVKFPTPLINRLEKHFVLTSSILEEWQGKVLHIFEEWISKFTTTRFDC